MRKEAVNKTPEEISPSPTLYWININDVVFEDVTALLDIYKEITGRNPNPIGKAEYDELYDEFKGDIGYAKWRISKTSVLEWRRRLITDNEMYVRFKIRRENGAPNNSFLQNKIDNYFRSRNKAKTTGQILNSTS